MIRKMDVVFENLSLVICISSSCGLIALWGFLRCGFAIDVCPPLISAPCSVVGFKTRKIVSEDIRLQVLESGGV